MTIDDILVMPRLETDAQLDMAIAYLNRLLGTVNNLPTYKKKQELIDKLSDLIWEYEERTDILNPNRPYPKE